MRRYQIPLLLAVALAAFGAPEALAAPAARAAHASCTEAPALADLTSAQDVDDDGESDLVLGVPAATAGGQARAGVLDVHYLTDRLGTRRTQRVGAAYFGQPVRAGDQFGATWAFVDANGDHCADLVVGLPGAGGGRGAVLLVLGSLTGLSPGGAVRVAGRTPGEHFGAAIATDDRGAVWVGAPNRTVSGHRGAGAVDELRAGHATLTRVASYTENSSGVPGVAETGDHFGLVIAPLPYAPFSPGASWAAVAIGEPYEDVGRKVNAGSVTVLRISPAHRLTGAIALNGDSPRVPGTAAAGDHFGAALSVGYGLAVGVPDRDVHGHRDAGVVVQFTARSGIRYRYLRTLFQGGNSVPGAAEAGDRFGASLLSGGFIPCIDDGSTEDLAIGAPGETLGGHAGAGDVSIVSARPRQKTDPATTVNDCSVVYRQTSRGKGAVPGTVETGDGFGTTLAGLNVSSDAEGNFVGGARPVFGVPGEDLGHRRDAGEVEVGVGPGPVRAFTDSGGSVAGERYGAGRDGSADNGAFNLN